MPRGRRRAAAPMPPPAVARDVGSASAHGEVRLRPDRRWPAPHEATPQHHVASLPRACFSGVYLATQALNRWDSLSRFSSQNLSLIYSAEAMFCGAVARFGNTFLSISSVEALVVGP